MRSFIIRFPNCIFRPYNDSFVDLGAKLAFEKCRFHAHERVVSISKNCSFRAISAFSAAIQEAEDETQMSEDDNPPDKRRKRRKKHGNQGKVPWNKGVKHTAETRALIKKNTIAALKDPKVRKKMAEHPRPHSDEIKAKISSSMRRKWDKRLLWKRLGEKFYMSWLLSIAEAARRGGDGQSELSYEKNQIKKKEIKQSVERKVRVEKVKVTKKKPLKEKVKKRSRKQEERSYTNYAKDGVSLKQKLTKIRLSKPKNLWEVKKIESLSSESTKWKKLETELVNGVDARGEQSLAEQIRAAKFRRQSLIATLDRESEL